MRSVALLRAVNVGGNTIKMAELKTMFEKMKFKDVRTFIASGNVIFTHDGIADEALRESISAQIAKTFGLKIDLVIRSMDELQALLKLNPFKSIKIGGDTRVYVTLLPSEPSAAAWKKLLEYQTKQQSFSKDGRDVFIIYSVPVSAGKPFSNMLIEKTLGMPATTRGWSTITKIAAL